MGGGSRALLEVRRTPFNLFPESFELKQKAKLVQISIQTQIDTVGERTDALSSAPGKSAFRQTTDYKEISFIKKEGVITREGPIAPKANLSA
jgi:hypothetical protein